MQWKEAKKAVEDLDSFQKSQLMKKLDSRTVSVRFLGFHGISELLGLSKKCQRICKLLKTAQKVSIKSRN